MEVGMMGQGRSPAMQHGGQADAGAKVLGIASDGDQRLGGGLEQNGIDGCLVLVGDMGDRCRQGENHMVIGHRQQFRLTRDKPILGHRALAFGAMAVAAGIVGDVGMAALLASRHMTAERRRAAVLDGRHDLQLAKAHMTGIGPTPGRPVGTEDIRDLQ